MAEDAPTPAALQAELEALLAAVQAEGSAIAAHWRDALARPDFAAGAQNLACYLALRHRELRPLQRALMPLGLSSLGRIEGRVLPGLQAVAASLAALSGRPGLPHPAPAEFFAGEQWLARNTRAVLGPPSPGRPVGLMVTCPSEAAEDPGFTLALAMRGVEALRINCAHDDAAAWGRMIAHAEAAEAATGHRMRVIMDLAGPKIRTGAGLHPAERRRILAGEALAIVPPGGLAAVPPGLADFAIECSLAEVLRMVLPRQRVFIDDGRIGAVVEACEGWGLLARILSAPEDGARLKPEKGLNFPDTELHCAALTDKDRADLDFVARHADGIGYSFVQSAGDVQALQAELAARRPQDWRQLALVLKIETVRAVHALPGIVVQAAGQQPAAIMIARGDLAVEIGFARLAEMQEEILWIGEAAHVPVIWATQVLEHLIRKGAPLRGEMTDAAMGGRAECIMLNKGPHLLQALDTLEPLLRRMGEHQRKKTPQLRALASW